MRSGSILCDETACSVLAKEQQREIQQEQAANNEQWREIQQEQAQHFGANKQHTDGERTLCDRPYLLPLSMAFQQRDPVARTRR
jgi:hypothetical protein